TSIGGPAVADQSETAIRCGNIGLPPHSLFIGTKSQRPLGHVLAFHMTIGREVAVSREAQNVYVFDRGRVPSRWCAFHGVRQAGGVLASGIEESPDGRDQHRSAILPSGPGPRPVEDEAAAP
ncbi:hypothetical protein AB0L10_45045, partial [Streptomyces flaveolus]|uniref:hypothetical protein n=1 Tax=Streptomyces flaveolus TaxID=67297 RepID=UPI00343DD3F0